jgi:VCBS repeat-containing protein
MQMHRINTIIRVLFVLFIWVTCTQAEDIRFAVIADHRDSFLGLENALEFIDSQNVDFIIVPGDFDPTGESYVNYYSAHGYTVGPEHQPDRQEIYFVLGNHDGPPFGEVYFRNNIAPHYPANGPDSAPEGTIFSFDRGDFHFVVTNQYWNYSSGGYTPEQLDWIAQDLASSQKHFKFVIGHEPAFPQFRHVGDSLDADPQMRDDFWQILSDNNVTAYLCGHTHYIYSDLVDGVYQLDAGEAKGDSLDVIIVNAVSTAVTAHLFSTNGSVPAADDEFETIVLHQPDNVPPVANAGADQSALVNDTVTLDGSGSSDVDGDTLSFKWSFASKPNGSSATLSSTTAAKPSFVGDVAGSYVVQLIVNDGTANSQPDTVSISTENSPTAVNEPPIVVDDDYTMEEDKQLNVPEPGVLSNDSDPDADSITALMVDDVKNGTLTLYENGSFTYNPSLDFSSTDSFTYRADDGQFTSNIATVTITVNDVNDPPLADANGPYSGTVGIPVSLDGSGSSDSDGTIISYKWDFGDGSKGSGVSPAHNYQTPGTFIVRLTATDDAGATDTATTTAEIAEKNQPPLAADDDYTTKEDTQLNVPGPGVLGNDSDPDGDPITAILVSNTSNGNLTLNGDGSFTYYPDLNFDGTDHFTYVTNEGQLESNIVATVTITVNPVNDAPVAVDDAFSVDKETQLNITAQSVLYNDIDPDDDPITAILVDDVINGSLTLNVDGTFTYDPNPDYFGEDSFTYYANDGQLDSDVATATITVNPPGVVDLDIAGFRVTKRVSLKRVKPIGIRLVVRNNGSVNGEERRSATVVGTQNGEEVFRYNSELTGDRRNTLQFGPYTPKVVGDIIWTVTIHDDDIDADEATAFTKVVN